MGQGWLGFPDSYLVKTLMELIFYPCGEFRWSPEGPVSQVHFPHFHVSAPGIFSDLVRSFQMLKREWCADLWSGQKLWWILNPCGDFRWSPEGPVNQIHCSHLHSGTSGIFSDLLRSVQMPKREWGEESNGKLPHLFIPSKTAILVPEFAVEGLLLERTISRPRLSSGYNIGLWIRGSRVWSRSLSMDFFWA